MRSLRTCLLATSFPLLFGTALSGCGSGDSDQDTASTRTIDGVDASHEDATQSHATDGAATPYDASTYAMDTSLAGGDTDLAEGANQDGNAAEANLDPATRADGSPASRDGSAQEASSEGRDGQFVSDATLDSSGDENEAASLPDGPCDDGNPCTEADTRIGGVCSGRPLASAGQLLGTVFGFADNYGLASSAGFLSENRVVYMTGHDLTLVGVANDRLTVLDRYTSPYGVNLLPLGTWVRRPGTFFLPLPNARMAFVEAQDGIEIFDLSHDQFTWLSRYGFPSGENAISAAAAAGDRIWTCLGGLVQTYEIHPSSFEITLGSSLTLAHGSCQDMALSTDQNTLYVTTSAGLARIDVSRADGTMSSLSGALDGKVLLDVSVTDQHVAVFELTNEVGFGGVTVLRTSDLSTVATFPEQDTGNTPIGFTLVSGGLLLERARIGDHDYPLAEFYSLGAGGAARVSTTGVINSIWSMAMSMHVTGYGHYAILEPAHQMVRIDPQSGSFTPVQGLQQGSFYDVSMAGPDLVEVHGPSNMQLVDISHPETPTVRQGETFWPLNVEALQLEMRSTGAAFMNWPRDVTGGNVPEPYTSLLWATPSALPSAAGSIVNDDEDDAWVAAGNYIYQIAAKQKNDFRLRRFPISGVSRANQQTVQPDVDQTLSLTIPSGLDQLGQFKFDVDPATSDIVIMAPGSNSSNGTEGTELATFSFAQGTYVPASRRSDSTFGNAVAMRSGRIVVAAHDRLFAADASGHTLGTFTVDPSALYPSRILAIRGDLVYVAATYAGKGRGVVVLQLPDLRELGRYTTPDNVYSVAELGNHLVFGMRSALSVASPFCPATPDR